MTYEEMKTHTTELLGGRELGDTLFSEILNMEKDKLEAMRNWVILETEDTSLTHSSSDTYETQHALPSRFLGFFGRPGERVFMKSGDDVQYLRPLPMNKKIQYRDVNGYYFVDHKNNSIHITGSYDKSYTIHMFILQGSEDIADGTDWSFPSRFHPLLPANVAVRQKGEIDYDDINARMVQFHGLTIEEMRRAMVFWDAKQKQDSLNV